MDLQGFQDRVDDYLLRTASPADVAELEQLLRAEPRLRRLLVERCLLEVHLRKAFAGTVVPPVVKRRFVGRFVIGGLVAAALFLALGLSWLAIPRETPLRADKALPTQAAVVQAKNTVIAGKLQIDGQVVEQLPEEKWFEVADDTAAVVRLVDGSAMELTPGSKARLRDRREGVRQAVELSQGTGKFKVAPGGGTFRVDTNVGNVQVLGTEFSVKLEPRRSEKRRERGRNVLSVSVTEGSVRIEAEGKVTVLRAGDSRVFGREKRDDDD